MSRTTTMSNQYWEDRWLNLAIAQERRVKPAIKKTEKLFEEVQQEIMDEIERWYRKYADNDGLSYEEAVRFLDKVEQRSWNMELSEFRAKAKSGGYDQLLNREYYSSRVTRLKMLRTQSSMQLLEMAKEREEDLTKLLRDEFTENYMRSIYETHSQQGKILDGRIATDFGTYNQREIDAVINQDWKGSNFSKRVWKADRDWLPEELEKTLTHGLKQGQSYDQMAERLNKRFDVAKNRAITLIQTEAKHVRMQASLEAMKQTGVDRYLFNATLEVSTCEDCGNLDGEDFLIKDAMPGENLPVIHPNCRCTIVPFIEEALRSNTRWMRDPKTGKGRRVPRMTYNEWAKKYKDAA